MSASTGGRHHPGCIEDRGTYLRVILQYAGTRHSYRLDHLDRKAAAQFAREQMRVLEAAHDAAQAAARQGIVDQPTVSAFLTQFRREVVPTRAPGTQRSYRDSLGAIELYFVRELGDPRIADVQPKHVLGFIAWRRTQRRAGRGQQRRDTPLSNRTVQKDWAVLHRVLQYAVDLELRAANPARKAAPPAGDPRAPVLLTDEQFERLLTACASRPMLRLYALTLAETGMRSYSEALHLRWEDVDLAQGFILIQSGTDGHRTKSGRSRYTPMTARLREAMKAHFADYRLAGSPWIFHHDRARRGAKPGDRIRSMRTAFDRAARAAGIPATFHRHDLRHRRVTSWLAAGANPVHVKEAVGHADLRTTMGYTHLAKEHLRALVDGPPAGATGGRAASGDRAVPAEQQA